MTYFTCESDSDFGKLGTAHGMLIYAQVTLRPMTRYRKMGKAMKKNCVVKKEISRQL